jgi:flagellar biosynthesis/type III secretory pathway protein FliH
MLMNEWKLEDALVVERAEGREEGLAAGWAKGREEGWAEAWQQLAGKALAEGLSLEPIQKITGLNIDEINNLALKGKICCSPDVIGFGFNTLFERPNGRGIKPSP